MNEEKKATLAAKSRFDFVDLCEIMKILRDRDGCPWDAEQTHKSIRNNLLEEAYEAVEGIDTSSPELLCEELGDLLLQIVFHAEISCSEKSFDINDVITGICLKLIIRHPHVFGDKTVSGSDEVLNNWAKIKYETKGMTTVSDTLNGVSRALPATVRAQKLQKRAESFGKYTSEFEKSKPDAAELSKKSEDIGRRLFRLADEARSCGIDAEQALYDYNESFLKSVTE